jgi:hypothetical protein
VRTDTRSQFNKLPTLCGVTRQRVSLCRGVLPAEPAVGRVANTLR